jgi:hypothetical protein
MRAALSPGAGVVYDGQRWEVAGLAPPSVLLAGPAGELRRVSISHLLAARRRRHGNRRHLTAAGGIVADRRPSAIRGNVPRAYGGSLQSR